MTWTLAISWGAYSVGVVLIALLAIALTSWAWSRGRKWTAAFVVTYFTLLLLLIPMPAHALEIVTCERAAGLMADLASARDHGMEEPETRRLLYAWIRYYHVSDIQGARLRYDMHGLFSDYVLRHATPGEIRAGMLHTCPREYAP